MIETVNSYVNVWDSYVCFARPDGFGKTTDAAMLAAYYSKGCDSAFLFDNLDISLTDSYHKHLNKHNVIYFNMYDFYKPEMHIKELINTLSNTLLSELQQTFHEVYYYEENDLELSLNNISDQTHNYFIFIIDDWDAPIRDKHTSIKDIEKYTRFLRLLFKDQPYVELVYMTGILPIKKFGIDGGLNCFDEITIFMPYNFENYFGFTDNEVKILCEQYDTDYQEISTWYKNNHFKKGTTIFHSYAIIQAILNKTYKSYLNIHMDDYMRIDGLKEAFTKLITGEKIHINPHFFKNDLISLTSVENVLILLVYLGCLAYDDLYKEVYIPNKEALIALSQYI